MNTPFLFTLPVEQATTAHETAPLLILSPYSVPAFPESPEWERAPYLIEDDSLGARARRMAACASYLGRVASFRMAYDLAVCARVARVFAR